MFTCSFGWFACSLVARLSVLCVGCTFPFLVEALVASAVQDNCLVAQGVVQFRNYGATETVQSLRERRYCCPR